MKKSLIGLCCISLLLLYSCKTSAPELLPNPISDKTINYPTPEEKDIPVNPLRNLYFGDLHVHTSLSIDAYIGGTLNGPDQAYRFAKGEVIEVLNVPVKLRRPLDFSAVTDHAEMLGEMHSILDEEEDGHNTIVARYLRGIHTDDHDLPVDTTRQRRVFNKVLKKAGSGEPQHPGFFKGYGTTMNAWQVNLDAAEEHYIPGTFTTFAGYEWTLAEGAAHLHRNLIFRDMMVPDYPMSSLELRNQEALWHWMEEITEKGATVLAIPHNTNLSDGGTFTSEDEHGHPIDSAHAQLRQTFEPLVEVHQVKGNSEVNAIFWKNDEFANFENYSDAEPKENDYVRYALKKGLEHEEHIGINPFKYGMIGSTDSHNATPGDTEEDNFTGSKTVQDSRPETRRNMDWILDPAHKVYEVVNPGGLVAVWAEANTRGHIYDALKRKETYATSGNRIQLRFFAGFDFTGEYATHDALLKDAYAKGVPMGNDIHLTEGKAPQFLIWAGKDPDYANLDRVQVIKGWYANGEMHEQIFNVALSDGRVLNDQGEVPDNGATVNMETGEWSYDKGASELQVLWEDPDFDKEVRSFYYLRVLEVPTASWRLWDQINHGVKYPEDAELTIRERAWSSPIWYSPED